MMYPKSFGTQKGLLPYIFSLVKQLETALPGVKNHTRPEYHRLDSQRITLPGVWIFAHLRVSGRGTDSSTGVPDFQVRETIRTWNTIGLTASELLFQA